MMIVVLNVWWMRKLGCECSGIIEDFLLAKSHQKKHIYIWFLNPLSTDKTPVCGWRFELVIASLFASEFLQNVTPY